VIVIDMPAPPSVNVLWRYSRRTGKPHSSPAYMRWQENADRLFLAQKRRIGRAAFNGPYKMHVVIAANIRGDLDNKTKACGDALQRWRIVRNDKDCVEVRVSRGEAPAGCRVIVEAP
jgi:Holliday junction resolvase RusA-like endonuclease